MRFTLISVDAKEGSYCSCNGHPIHSRIQKSFENDRLWRLRLSVCFIFPHQLSLRISFSSEVGHQLIFNLQTVADGDHIFSTEIVEFVNSSFATRRRDAAVEWLCKCNQRNFVNTEQICLFVCLAFSLTVALIIRWNARDTHAVPDPCAFPVDLSIRKR